MVLLLFFGLDIINIVFVEFADLAEGEIGSSGCPQESEPVYTPATDVPLSFPCCH